MQNMKYQGQTAFVTGGSSGIARALTQRLVDQGFVISYRQSKADFHRLIETDPGLVYSLSISPLRQQNLSSLN